MARHTQVTAEDNLDPLGERIVLRLRHGGIGSVKWFREVLSGDDWSRVRRVWSRRTRVVDRENNRYIERVVGSDGTLLHECDGPLDEHQDHGAAKPPQQG